MVLQWRREDLWAAVLGGGEGTRLSTLTHLRSRKGMSCQRLPIAEFAAAIFKAAQSNFSW
jgi:dTDP-glucose pyrophosphorylase